MTDRTEHVIPTAARLVAAVRARDTNAVTRALAGDVDWPALAVLLADNIGCVHDTRLMAPPAPLSSPAVLTDAEGRWVQRGLVRVWQASS